MSAPSTVQQDKITIRVHGTGVVSANLSIPTDATAWDLAKAIEAASQHSMPANRMRLIYKSTVIPFEAELSTFKITNGSTVLVAKAEAELFSWDPKNHSSLWDYDFRDKDDSKVTFKRGQYEYIRPCGYYRFAFTVSGRYDGGNDAWLDTDANAWPVAYFAPGHNKKGESLRSAGYSASKGLPKVPLDPPFGYFFAMDVAHVEPYATAFTAADGVTRCSVVVQARVDPSKIVQLSDGIWAARSADAFRPYGLLVKGAGAMNSSVMLAALNSLMPYAEVLPKDQYHERTAGGVERGAGVLCPDACVQVLSIGGDLYNGKNLAPAEHDTLTLEWPDGVDRSVAEAVLKDPKFESEADCTQEGSNYVISGPRRAVHSLMTLLLAAIDGVGPVEWTSKGLKTTLVQLTTNSDAYKHVSKRFFESMPATARITRIDRVENRRLYARYAAYRDAVQKKCTTDARPQHWTTDCVVERELWHGTGSTNPAVLYEGDGGFKRNDSGPGLWGRACYFADKASYACKTYVHAGADGRSKQVFLATVATGLSEVRAASSSIKDTSLIPNSTLERDQYDSIKGTRDGSGVYMTYTDHSAYPSYLVTYEVNDGPSGIFAHFFESLRRLTAS